MESTIYSDGTYLANNRGWHADDSAWKANHIASLLGRNAVVPRTLCEIGCGAGEILRSLAARLDPSTRFFGYDISPSDKQNLLCYIYGNLGYWRKLGLRFSRNACLPSFASSVM